LTPSSQESGHGDVDGREKRLAGHRALGMTQRYVHLSPAAFDAAIRLLEHPAGPRQVNRAVPRLGDVVETAAAE